jgi:hypothetical protein
MIDQNINQNEFILTLVSYTHNLQLEFEDSHYQSNAEYYWKNKNQFISIINKGIPDDKLKIIFQTHFQKVTKNSNNEMNNKNIEMNNKNNNLFEEEKIQVQVQICYPPVKIVKTNKFSVYEWV